MISWIKRPLERLPAEERARLRRRLLRLRMPAWLAMVRTMPLSSHYGFDRGTPIDRYYIACFLEGHRADIRGQVLEVMDSRYTSRYGNEMTVIDVLDIDPENPYATVVADLTSAGNVPSNRYDCFIMTQTLQFIHDPHAAIAEIHRILRPGGVLLATMPGISKVDPSLEATDYWRFTESSCLSLFGDIFGPNALSIRTYGNVLSAMGFLTGLAREDLSDFKLDRVDRHFPVIVAVRATKSLEDPEQT